MVTGLRIGGAEKQVADLASELKKNGHDVLILSMTGCKEVEIDELIPVISLGMKKNLLSFTICVVKIIKILKEYKPDLVHSHMFHANIICRIVRLFCHIPTLINTAHSSNEGGSLRILSYKYTDFLADITTIVSKSAAEEFIANQAFRKDKIRVVYNGIRIEEFSGDREKKLDLLGGLGMRLSGPIYVAVGRLTTAKNYPFMIDVFQSYLNIYPDAKLLIIGDGELKGMLQSIIEMRKLESSVMLLGAQKNIKDWLATGDAFLMTSMWEGFGIVIAEAMLSKIPIITTKVGGIPEVLDKYGFQVAPDDKIEFLSAMQEFTNGKKYDLEGARNRILDHFSMAAITCTWESIYTEIEKKF